MGNGNSAFFSHGIMRDDFHTSHRGLASNHALVSLYTVYSRWALDNSDTNDTSLFTIRQYEKYRTPEDTSSFLIRTEFGSWSKALTLIPEGRVHSSQEGKRKWFLDACYDALIRVAKANNYGNITKVTTRQYDAYQKAHNDITNWRVLADGIVGKRRWKDMINAVLQAHDNNPFVPDDKEG